jgi:hypothetical protein
MKTTRIRAPGRRPHYPARFIVGLAGLLALLSACAGRESLPGLEVTRPANQGEPRSLAIGFAAIPASRTQDSYLEVFATTARYGDVVTIQRTPPWAEFMPGGQISQATEDTTRLETGLLERYGWLQSFYAIDPTDPAVQRSRVAQLPPEIDPAAGFAQVTLRDALVNYAAYIAKNYRPDYLAIGVEVNMLYERSRQQFDAFVEAYTAAYDVAKAANPGMLIFPTFQLEDLLGRLDQVHEPHWEVLDPFRGRMDALAITTFPFVANIQTARDIGPDYYSQLRRYFDGPIIIAQAGYASAPVDGRALIGTEEDQEAFLSRLLADAEEYGFALVSWIAPRDPAVAAVGFGSRLKDTGLRKADGSNKLAWTTWERWALRPFAGGR